MTEGPAAIPLAWTDEGTGEPLVLIHGYGAHGAVWAPWLAHLRTRYRVVNVDLTGFGAAPKPRDGAYDPLSLGGAVADLVRKLDLRDAALIGHSLGGGVALAAAVRLQDDDEGRLARLVSVAGAAYPQAAPPFVRFADHPTLSRVVLRLTPKRWLVAKVMRDVVVRDEVVTPERVATFADPLTDPDAQAALVACAAHIVPAELPALIARYRGIEVPTLCLWGRDDPVVPLWVGERLSREIPNAQLVILDRCGHLPVDEQPQESLDALLEFLAG
jgi:pimeloyl-ACP methyl ester carboxylesterase